MLVRGLVLAVLLLGCASSAPARGREPSDPAGPPGEWHPPPPSPTLEASEQMELVLTHKVELADCVAAQSRAAPEEHGRAVLEWDTSLEGDLRNVVVRDAPAPLSDCLVAAVSTWKARPHAVPSARFSFPVKY